MPLRLMVGWVEGAAVLDALRGVAWGFLGFVSATNGLVHLIAIVEKCGQ